MPHMWVLFFIVGSGPLSSAQLNGIYNFKTLESCEFTRAQMVRKMDAKKATCIEIDPAQGAPPSAPHPEDHDHGRQ